MKKIIYILLFFFVICACGKKSDPEYKSSIQHKDSYSKLYFLKKI